MKELNRFILMAGLIIALLVAFSWYRSCDSSKVDYWRGQYEAVTAQNELEKSKFLRDIETLQKVNREKDKKISILTKDIEDVYDTVAHKDNEIAQLEEEFTQLQLDADKVDNLQEQVNLWKEKWTLAQNIIEKKDAIIFNLQEKYDNQVKITNDYHSLYENELEINKILEKNLAVLTRKSKRQTFTDTIKNVVIITAAGYITYSLIKEKQ